MVLYKTRRYKFFLLLHLFTILFVINYCIPLEKHIQLEYIGENPRGLGLVANHSPIYIDASNPAKDWDKFPSISGNGSYNNPYLIRDLIIDGSAVFYSIRIDSSNYYFKIENCTFINYGFKARYAHNGILYNNSFLGLGQNSIDLFHASNFSIEKNICYKNSSTDLLITNSNNVSITNNIYTGNIYSGISVYSSENLIILNNNCSNSDYGIYLMDSKKTNISNNIVIGKKDGIYLSNSSYNSIDENLVRNNKYGITSWSSSYNNFRNNTCINNAIGIYVSVSSENISISSNYVKDSIWHGIQVSGANSPKIRDNFCINNTQYGISLSNSNFGKILNNSCLNNGWDGISLSYSENAEIFNNTCTVNGWNGIGLSTSNNVNIYGNHLNQNLNGINLYNSSLNEIYGNNCYINDLWAIYINGTGNQIYEDNIGIMPINASFEVNNTIIEVDKQLLFKDKSIGGIPEFLYQWNFGDGSENSTAKDPAHKYSESGKYLVVLTIIDVVGNISVSKSIEITVNEKEKTIDGYSTFLISFLQSFR
jgi:parallel beta-helix repeat protein